MGYPNKRNLDGCYFRVEREGEWESVCFSDLALPEQYDVLERRTAEWLKQLCISLAGTLHDIGEELDLERVEEEEDEH